MLFEAFCASTETSVKSVDKLRPFSGVPFIIFLLWCHSPPQSNDVVMLRLTHGLHTAMCSTQYGLEGVKLRKVSL